MKFLIAALLFVVPFTHGKAIKSRINDINNDSDLEKFIRDSLEKFRDVLTKGFPALDWPILDPFKDEGFFSEINEDMTKLNLTVQEVTVQDASKFTIQNLQADTDMNFHVEILIPQISSFGGYDVQGTVGKIFPLWGNGSFSINMTSINIIANGKFISKNETLELSNINLDLRWDQLNVFAENLLGSGDFSKAVMKMLSKLAKNMFEMHKEEMLTNFDPLVVEFINYLNEHYGVATEIHLLS